MPSYLGSDAIKELLCLRRIQKTYKKSEVPLLFHEPGIESGYRPINKSWSYYFISALQLHNESMNVWTHFIGFFVILGAMVHYHRALDFSNAHTWPMVIFGLCCLIFCVLSTVAHLLEAKSFYIHHFVYLLDYAGVGLYGFGTMTLLFYYSVDKTILLLFGHYAMPVNTIMAVVCCFCGCYGKLNYMRPYPIQRKVMNIVGNALHQLMYASPVFLRFLTQDESQPEDIRATVFKKHLLVGQMFLISVAFFATHLPEKCYPGKFDFFGYSHAFFHIFVIVTVLLQFDTAAYELKTRDLSEEAFKRLAKPSSLFLYGLAVLVADAYIIVSSKENAMKIAEKYEKQS